MAYKGIYQNKLISMQQTFVQTKYLICSVLGNKLIIHIQMIFKWYNNRSIRSTIDRPLNKHGIYTSVLNLIWRFINYGALHMTCKQNIYIYCGHDLRILSLVLGNRVHVELIHSLEVTKPLTKITMKIKWK